MLMGWSRGHDLSIPYFACSHRASLLICRKSPGDIAHLYGAPGVFPVFVLQ